MTSIIVANEMRLCGVEHRMIRMMCAVRLVDRVSTDVLRDRVGVVVTIEDFIIVFYNVCSGMVMSSIKMSAPKYVRSWSMKYQGKEKGRPRKSWEECIKKDLEQYGLRREDAYDRVKCQEHIKAKIANPGQPG